MNAAENPEAFERRGYFAGLQGKPSLPGTYQEADRQAYERAYDLGRSARLAATAKASGQ